MNGRLELHLAHDPAQPAHELESLELLKQCLLLGTALRRCIAEHVVRYLRSLGSSTSRLYLGSCQESQDTVDVMSTGLAEGVVSFITHKMLTISDVHG